MWTNTCCSHPLDEPDEGGEDLESAIEGAKRAVVRKLKHELNIDLTPEHVQKLDFLTRIIYKAVNISPLEELGKENFAEHESGCSPNHIRKTLHKTHLADSLA